MTDWNLPPGCRDADLSKPEPPERCLRVTLECACGYEWRVLWPPDDDDLECGWCGAMVDIPTDLEIE